MALPQIHLPTTLPLPKRRGSKSLLFAYQLFYHQWRHHPYQTTNTRKTGKFRILRKQIYKYHRWLRGAQKTNLPIPFLRHRDVCMFTLVMLGVHPTKNNLTPFIFISIAVKPKWENWFFNKTLIDHVVPVMNLLRYIIIVIPQRSNLPRHYQYNNWTIHY